LTLEKFSQIILPLTRRIYSDEQYHYHEVERHLFRAEYDKALKLMAHIDSKYSSMKWTILRGKAYWGLKETQKAKSNFTQAEMSAHIFSVIALKHLVEIYDACGEEEKTISSLSKLTQMSPNNKDRRVKLAEIFIEHDRLEEAREVLASLADDKQIPQEMKLRIANLFEKAGFQAEATNLKMQMLDGNLDDFVFCNDLAIRLRRQDRYDLAEEIYLKILKNHPETPIILFNRGVNLSFWGKKEGDRRLLREATDCFRKALELDPNLKSASDALMRLKADRLP